MANGGSHARSTDDAFRRCPRLLASACSRTPRCMRPRRPASSRCKRLLALRFGRRPTHRRKHRHLGRNPAPLQHPGRRHALRLRLVPPDVLRRRATEGSRELLRERSAHRPSHAPRGARRSARHAECSFTLGQSRADAVARYLGSQALARRAMMTTSRGARDATGSDETGWAHDRRLDVLLAN